MATPPFSSIVSQRTPAPIPAFPVPVPVIGPQFCSSLAIELEIVKEFLGNGNYVVKDIKGNQILKVKGALLTLHGHRVLCNTAGNPIVTLRRKRSSFHKRWNVFVGESKESRDRYFTVVRSSVVQMKTKLHVFLANNTSEKVCDYKIEGSWMERSCVIYAGDTVIAQMRKKTTFTSVVAGIDDFLVTVYANIDYAFIVTLILIFAEVNVEIIPKTMTVVSSITRAVKFASSF